MAKQPVPVAKRLTIDGLNDMGIQAPMIVQPTPKFPPRSHEEEMRIMYELDQGVDEEDMSYFKQSFQKYVNKILKIDSIKQLNSMINFLLLFK